MRRVLFATGVAAIGGFLFGYDTAVISGAIGSLRTFFRLEDAGQGLAAASAILGCIPGSMAAGFLSDRFGRKKTLFLCAVFYAVSAVWSAVPGSFAGFLLARFLGGLGVGVSSMVCPVYIAELAPEKIRGRLGALFQLGIVTGIFIVFFVNYRIQQLGDVDWNVRLGWRWMLGSETLPAAAFLGLLAFIPESPRWLALNGRGAEARAVLVSTAGADQAERELQAISRAAAGEEGRFGELFGPAYRRPLMIAVSLAIFCQLSGINAIMYYAPEVFKGAGISADAAFASSVWVGLVNLVFTFVAIGYVDRAGRRTLLVIGTAVQWISLAVVGAMFALRHSGLGLLAAILVYCASFAMAMGPIPWIVISEIFPGRIRGRAASVGVFMIWVVDNLVTWSFPTFRTLLGSAGTFWIYAGFSLLSMVYVLACLPETKGRTLEEIEASWRRA